jgi:hypothetical protein
VAPLEAYQTCLMKECGETTFRSCPGRGATSFTLLRRAGTEIDTCEVGPDQQQRVRRVVAQRVRAERGPMTGSGVTRRLVMGERRIAPSAQSALRVIDPAGWARQVLAMRFEILGEISSIETFATGSGIREIARLRRIHGRGRWRKRKGIARVRLSDGSIHVAELHWYEAAGIGRKEFKIKHLL